MLNQQFRDFCVIFAYGVLQRYIVVIHYIDVGTVLNQQFHDFGVIIAYGIAQRRIAVAIFCIDVSTVFNQQFRDFCVIFAYGIAQRRIAVVIFCIDVGAVFNQQFFDYIDIIIIILYGFKQIIDHCYLSLFLFATVRKSTKIQLLARKTFVPSFIMLNTVPQKEKHTKKTGGGEHTPPPPRKI